MSKKKTDKLKQKLEEAEDLPKYSDMVCLLPPPKVIEKKHKLGEPIGEGINILFEATMQINTLSNSWH